MGGGVVRPVAILTRNVEILNLSGKIHIKNEAKKIGMIKIGFHGVGILDQKYERAIWSNTGDIIVEGKVTLRSGTRISNSGKLYLGEDFFVSGNTSIVSTNEIKFGKHNLISWDVLIMDTDFHPIYDYRYPDKITNPSKPIFFGDNVWVGCRSTILKGTKISNDTIVASNSVIRSKYEKSNVIISSNGVVKEEVCWET